MIDLLMFGFWSQQTEYDMLLEEDQIGFVMVEQVPGTEKVWCQFSFI